MIDITKEATVFIGRRGEHHYRNLEFDVSSLLGNEYPGTSLHILLNLQQAQSKSRSNNDSNK